ncbi:hypothetical protein B0H19DRAFT_1079461 [Mycena capillaripes]|nr:hypothetical protein B0H19DRAFT_1079461 [Mycena capillaripes]
MVWLAGSSNPNEIKDKALEWGGNVEFRKRLIAFLEDTISTSVPPDVDQTDLKSTENRRESSTLTATGVQVTTDIPDVIDSHLLGTKRKAYFGGGQTVSHRFSLSVPNIGTDLRIVPTSPPSSTEAQHTHTSAEIEYARLSLETESRRERIIEAPEGTQHAYGMHAVHQLMVVSPYADPNYVFASNMLSQLKSGGDSTLAFARHGKHFAATRDRTLNGASLYTYKRIDSDTNPFSIYKQRNPRYLPTLFGAVKQVYPLLLYSRYLSIERDMRRMRSILQANSDLEKYHQR